MREAGNTPSHESLLTSTDLAEMLDTDLFSLYSGNSHFGDHNAQQ